MKNFFKIIYKLLPTKLKEIWKRVEYSNIGSRFVKGAFWSLFGAIISKGLMLLASILVARILGQTEYGELGIIRSTVNMFSVFAGFGLGLTATKFISELSQIDKIKTGKIIGLTTSFAVLTGLIISLIILIASPLIAQRTLDSPHLITELRLGAFILFFSAINGAQTGILAGFEDFKKIAFVNLLSGLLAFPIQIIFTYLWGLKGSVIGFGFNFVIQWFVNFISIRKVSKKFGIKIQYRDSFSEFYIIYKFSLPALLSGLLVTPVMWFCNVMLVRHNNGFNEMAIFDAANQWKTMILFVPGLLSKVALPLLSSTSNSSNRFKKVIKLNVIVNIVISLFLALGITFFAHTIMNSYGSGFAEGYNVLIILSFSSIFISANNVIGQAIASTGKMWHGLFLNIIWAIILITSSYFLIAQGYGALGLSISFLIAYLFHTIIQGLYVFYKSPKFKSL